MVLYAFRSLVFYPSAGSFSAFRPLRSCLALTRTKDDNPRLAFIPFSGRRGSPRRPAQGAAREGLHRVGCVGVVVLSPHVRRPGRASALHPLVAQAGRRGGDERRRVRVERRRRLRSRRGRCAPGSGWLCSLSSAFNDPPIICAIVALFGLIVALSTERRVPSTTCAARRTRMLISVPSFVWMVKRITRNTGTVQG